MNEGLFTARYLYLWTISTSLWTRLCVSTGPIRGQRGGQALVLIIGDRDTAGQRDLGMLAWRWGKVIAMALSASSL